MPRKINSLVVQEDLEVLVVQYILVHRVLRHNPALHVRLWFRSLPNIGQVLGCRALRFGHLSPVVQVDPIKKKHIYVFVQWTRIFKLTGRPD